MNNIPSNFTLEEVLRVVPRTPIIDLIEVKVAETFDLVSTKQDELDKLYNDYEHIEEQNGFKEQLLDNIIDLLSNKGSKVELVKEIRLAIEDSQVEL